MPYNVDPRVLYALVHGSPADVQAMLPFIQQASYVSPQQIQSEWEAQMPRELTDEYAQQRADEAYNHAKDAYINNSVRQIAESARARSTAGALGGTSNSFAQGRIDRINSDGSIDALNAGEAARHNAYNQEIQRINRRRAQMTPPMYAESFSDALGPWRSMIGSGGVGKQSGMSGGYSYGGGSSYSRSPLSSKLAQAGTGLYELINQMRRNNIGAKQIGAGVGSAISGVLHAPARFAQGIANGWRV